jgi:carbonic anhydrase/acetyltransferase-like protein (isoleucine patch superfamily)
MLVEHEGRSPTVDPGAWAAPTAVLCGDVRGASATQATRRYAELFGRHRDDTVIG